MSALAAIIAISLAWAIVPGRSPWDRAPMPPYLRAKIHTSAALVPPFAHEDSSLEDPASWPMSMELGGKHCDLSILGSSYDVGIHAKSLAAIPPGYRLTLVYSFRWPDSQQPAFGPSYSWDQNRRLWRRIWYEPDTVHYVSTVYVTYPSGQLFEYQIARRNQRKSDLDSLTQFTENYDRRGKLIGVGYKVYGGSQDRQFWWEGQRISETGWEHSRGVLLGGILRGSRSRTWLGPEGARRIAR